MASIENSVSSHSNKWLSDNWNLIPVGETDEGPAMWDIDCASHLLMTGSAGGGKTFIQSRIAKHCLASQDWTVFGIDVKYPHSKRSINLADGLRMTTDLRSTVTLLEMIEAEVHLRQSELQKEDVDHFTKLKADVKPIMLIIDHAGELLGKNGIKTEEERRNDQLRSGIYRLLQGIIFRGRSVGIHISLASQRSDATILPREFKGSFCARIAAGRMDSNSSLVNMGNDSATKIDSLRGSAYIQHHSEGKEFRIPFPQIVIRNP